VSAIASIASVELWALALGSPDALPSPFEPWLDNAERERAARFATPALRHDFITTRGMLRGLLARRTGHQPEGVPLRTGLRGKPVLAAEPPLHFNLSHSGRVALYALSHDVEVGIDVEAMRPLPDVDALVGRVMNAAQAEQWQALPPAERLPAFYRDWTRKEACVKASGDGLWAELPDIEFSGHGRLRAHDATGAQWTVLDLAVDTAHAAHAAALAWRGRADVSVAPLRWLDPREFA